jgi:hypothetical protein
MLSGRLISKHSRTAQEECVAMDFVLMTVNGQTVSFRQLSHGATFPSLLSQAGGDAISL